MANTLVFEYDAVGDILSIDSVARYAEQESDFIDDDVVARAHPETGRIENLDLLFFMRRMHREGRFPVPVNGGGPLGQLQEPRDAAVQSRAVS